MAFTGMIFSISGKHRSSGKDRVYRLFGIVFDPQAELEIEVLEEEPIDVEAVDTTEDSAEVDKPC